MYERFLEGDVSDTLDGKIEKGLSFFSNKAMAAGLEAANDIAIRGDSIKGVEGFLAKYATRQRYQNDPIGTIHVCRDLAGRGAIDNVLQFENRVDLDPQFADIPTITRNTKSGKQVGRRMDVVEEDPYKHIEYKGSSKDAPNQQFRMKKTEEIEFLNDVIYYAHPRGQVNFEWIIAPQLKTDDLKQKMLEMLGDTGKRDQRLTDYLSRLADEERLVFQRQLSTLIANLKADKIVKGGSYVP